MLNVFCKEKYEVIFNYVNLGIVVNKYMYDFCFYDMCFLVLSYIWNWIKNSCMGICIWKLDVFLLDFFCNI